MNTIRDWKKPVQRLERLMRLKTSPVAFKLLEDKKSLSEIPFLRSPQNKGTMCQMLNLVRNFSWTVGASSEDFVMSMCPSVIGLCDLPEFMQDGTFRSIVWTKSRADGKKYENSVPRMPTGQYEAVAMAPLIHNPFDPDIVLFYANPAQMILLINALQFENYEVMQFYCVGETSCADAIVRCYLNQKPALTIPCYGERRYGHTQDDELVMAIPADKMNKALRGMEALYRRGIRYPISYAGAEADLTRSFPEIYQSADFIEKLRGKDQRILLGVTGSIATGKTAVADKLEKLGAKTIDFDMLSRMVVQPGKPAYNEIVAHFGQQILRPDKSLDREKLREIVFRDLDKKKKLEKIQHARISDEFVRRVEQYAHEDPNAIIQAVVPLLIEVNMHPLFHHVLMVYTPEDVQKERLMARDNISEEMALNMIRSQLSVEEKKGYCDLVIDNSGSLEDTHKQVQALWDKLKT